MIQVIPTRLQRASDGAHAKLLLRALDQTHSLTISLPMDQARLVLAEMHGLATDQCAQHHLTAALVQALDGKVVGVVLREIEKGWSNVVVRLQTVGAVYDVSAGVIAAVAMAIHLGVPIFAEPEHIFREPELALQTLSDAGGSVPIPPAFRELMEGLDLSLPADGPDGSRA